MQVHAIFKGVKWRYDGVKGTRIVWSQIGQEAQHYMTLMAILVRNEA